MVIGTRIAIGNTERDNLCTGSAGRVEGPWAKWTNLVTRVSGSLGKHDDPFPSLESAINTALDGLRYDPTSDTSGPADLQVTSHFSSQGLLGYYSFETDLPGNPAQDDGPERPWTLLV